MKYLTKTVKSLNCVKKDSQKKLAMTQLLCGQAAAKWLAEDFSPVEVGFLWSNILFLQHLSLYFDINRDKYIAEIQSSVQEIQMKSGGNPVDVTLRQRARREAGSWPIFLLNLFYTVASFYSLGQILHVSKECPQLRWPLCVSERMCTFFLQLFTRLEDEHCKYLGTSLLHTLKAQHFQMKLHQ